jgi:hypothetical protein
MLRSHFRDDAHPGFGWRSKRIAGSRRSASLPSATPNRAGVRPYRMLGFS